MSLTPIHSHVFSSTSLSSRTQPSTKCLLILTSPKVLTGSLMVFERLSLEMKRKKIKTFYLFSQFKLLSITFPELPSHKLFFFFE
jgi:hypothetical protein